MTRFNINTGKVRGHCTFTYYYAFYIFSSECNAMLNMKNVGDDLRLDVRIFFLKIVWSMAYRSILIIKLHDIISVHTTNQVYF